MLTAPGLSAPIASNVPPSTTPSLPSASWSHDNNNDGNDIGMSAASAAISVNVRLSSSVRDHHTNNSDHGDGDDTNDNNISPSTIDSLSRKSPIFSPSSSSSPLSGPTPMINKLPRENVPVTDKLMAAIRRVHPRLLLAAFISLFYIRTWIGRYNRSMMKSDIIAGLSTALNQVPKALAFATLAGLPPEYGLYSAQVTHLPPYCSIIYGTC